MLNRNREAISTMEKLLDFNETPENNFILGAYNEKTGDTASAQKYYKKAIVAYDKLLMDSPDSMSYVNLYFTMLFIKDEDETIGQIRKSRINNSCFPWEETEIVLKDFDKAEFIEQL